MNHFSLLELPAHPWKNGGGATREIVAWPKDSTLDAFDWRVSVATITRDGPFSPFPGVDRTIMLLEGDGVTLSGGDINHRLERIGEPFTFSGEAPVHATLLGSVSRDLNLMCRGARLEAAFAVVREPVLIGPAQHGLVMSLSGTWCAGAARIEPEQGLWWAAQTEIFALSPDGEAGRAIVITLKPPGPAG